MSGVRTVELVRLPDLGMLRQNAKAAAILDMVICPNPEVRTFEYLRQPVMGFDIGRYNNQQGDCWSAAIGENTALVAGYNKESPISQWPADKLDKELLGSESALPTDLRQLLKLPSFDHGGRTFATWYARNQWHVPRGMIATSSLRGFRIDRLDVLARGAEAFIAWMHWASDRPLPDDLVRGAFADSVLAFSKIASFVDAARAESLRNAAHTIGYKIV